VVPLIGYNRHFATVEYGSEMQDYDDWGFDSIEVVEPIPQYGYLGIKSLPVGVNPANYYFCTLQGTDEWYYCPKIFQIIPVRLILPWMTIKNDGRKRK